MCRHFTHDVLGRLVVANPLKRRLPQHAAMGHAGEFNNSVQGLQLNPGKYMVKVGSGSEQEVNIEANKVAVIQAGK